MTRAMPNRPGAQFHDHPNMVAGRAALPRLLADFVDYEFCVQCPTPACRFRRFPVAPIVAAQPTVTVAEALARLRCRDCGQPPEIVGLSKPSINAGETWLALRIEADAWRPIRERGDLCRHGALTLHDRTPTCRQRP